MQILTLPRDIPRELLDIFDPLVKQGSLHITCRPKYFELRKGGLTNAKIQSTNDNNERN